MNKKLFFILIFFALILVLSNVSANEIEDTNITSTRFYLFTVLHKRMKTSSIPLKSFSLLRFLSKSSER